MCSFHVVYLEALTPPHRRPAPRARHLLSPFVLRSVDPPIDAIHGQIVAASAAIGKRIVLEFEDDLFLVIHLMIAGRLRWREPGKKPGMGPKLILASFEFAHGTLFFTEASSKKRASMQLVRGERGAARARSRRHRAARRDARAVSRRADAREPHAEARAHRSAPVQRHRQRLLGRDPARGEAVAAQADALADRRGVRAALRRDARDAARAGSIGCATQTGGGFPEKVTAFHDEMAVHGRFKQPCPVCGSPVQRIVYAANECNYCATCQTGGRLLADRSLSRLLKDDWPRSIDELWHAGAEPLHHRHQYM